MVHRFGDSEESVDDTVGEPPSEIRVRKALSGKFEEIWDYMKSQGVEYEPEILERVEEGVVRYMRMGAGRLRGEGRAYAILMQEWMGEGTRPDDGYMHLFVRAQAGMEDVVKDYLDRMPH